jgi:hypothetical protein
MKTKIERMVKENEDGRGGGGRVSCGMWGKREIPQADKAERSSEAEGKKKQKREKKKGPSINSHEK